MLVLTRKEGQSLLLRHRSSGDSILLNFVRIFGGKVPKTDIRCTDEGRKFDIERAGGFFPDRRENPLDDARRIG